MKRKLSCLSEPKYDALDAKMQGISALKLYLEEVSKCSPALAT